MKRLAMFIGVMIFLLMASLALEKFLGSDRAWLNASRHLLLGMCTGWGFIVFWEMMSKNSYQAAPALLIMVAVVSGSTLFGVLWEVFEYAFDMLKYRTDIGDPYIDTMKDLIMDVSGGAVTAIFFCQKKVR